MDRKIRHVMENAEMSLTPHIELWKAFLNYSAPEMTNSESTPDRGNKRSEKQTDLYEELNSRMNAEWSTEVPSLSMHRKVF